MSVDRYIEDERDRVSVDRSVDEETGDLDFETLRTGGMIKQRQKDLFTLRLKSPGGRVPLDRLAKILEVARENGGEYVHLSMRQSIEIPYVNFRDIGRIEKNLGEAGQGIASCGPRVRVPTACSGCEYNPNGLTDTQGMAQKVCDRFFGKRPLPHKFKISFSGCPIDCARTSGMDLGFQGAVRPEWDAASCIGCGICADACHEGAIESDPETGKPNYHPDKCLYCGDCIRTCPTESWQTKETGWIVRCGGKHGRHPMVGQKIAEFVPDEKIEQIVEAVTTWYDDAGIDEGRVRIGTLLLKPERWKSFLASLKPILGRWAVKSPPPFSTEIHFSGPAGRPPER